MVDDAPKPRFSPTAIPIGDAARLLSKVGGDPVSAEMLQTDVDLGAPTNPDRTLNLIHYATWLVRELTNVN